MKNSFLIILAVLAVLTASCSKGAKTTQQTTNNDSQIVDATSEQTVANYNNSDSGVQSQPSAFRNSRKRLPSR